MDGILNTTNNNCKNQHFGQIDLKIHYTVSAGVAERLGKKVEQAVVEAMSNVGKNSDKFNFEGTVIRMAACWHSYPEMIAGFRRKSRVLSLHLSDDHDDNEIISVDWEYF